MNRDEGMELASEYSSPVRTTLQTGSRTMMSTRCLSLGCRLLYEWIALLAVPLSLVAIVLAAPRQRVILV